MSSGETHPSALEIAQSLLDEEGTRRIEEHAAACERCAAELRQAREAAGKFHAHVFARTLPGVEGRFRRRPRWILWLAPLAAAASVALVFFASRPSPEEGPYGIKGAGALQAFGRRGDQPLTVHDGTLLRAGDRLRFAVQAGAARYVCIGSVDSRGANLYYPASPLGGDGGFEALPDSLVLDDSPGPERFFAVFSDAPLEEGLVRRQLSALAAKGPAAIRATRRLDLPWAQATLLIEKERP